MTRDFGWLEISLYRPAGFDNQKTARGFVGFFLRGGCPDFAVNPFQIAGLHRLIYHRLWPALWVSGLCCQHNVRENRMNGLMREGRREPVLYSTQIFRN